MSQEELFVKKTIGEILFDGYEDPLLSAAEIIKKFHIPIPGTVFIINHIYTKIT